MSDKQPEALRLADELDAMFGATEIDERVTAELRRLNEVNHELLEALEQMVSVFLDTEGRHGESENDAMYAASAAIAKATGENT